MASPVRATVVELRDASRARVPQAAVAALRGALQRDPQRRLLDATAVARHTSATLRAPPPFDPLAEAELTRETGELLEAVAFGRDDETVTRGRHAMRREAARLAMTNRSDTAARALGNVCLFVVRALLHRGHTADAHLQARQCLVMVPDLDAPVDVHPPDVRDLLDTVRSDRPGRLSVTSAPSPPSSCVVRLQGRRVGSLPVSVELVPGRYAVQVECGTAGLIREVEVTPERVQRLRVAPRLEQALQLGQPSVLIALDAAGALGLDDLAVFAEWASLSELWTIQLVGSVVLIRSFDRTSAGLLERSEHAEAVAPEHTLAARVEAATARAACGRSGCGAPDPNRSARVGPAAGGIVGGVGLTAMVGSWIAWQRAHQLATELDSLRSDDPAYEERRGDRDRAATAAIAVSAAGSVAFAGAVPFWLPDEEGVPWWSICAGVAGATAAGIGTALWLKHGMIDEDGEPPCPRDSMDCLGRNDTMPIAPLLVTQGASLLAIPGTHALRSLIGSRSETFQVGFGRDAVMLEWTHAVRAF